MNPLTNIKNINKLNELEAEYGISGKQSWHQQYKDSAYIYIGGLPYDLTEGDILCMFSQYGEIVNINLVRDKKSGKSQGFCFIAYEDQRSTILAVDNLNGFKILGRTIRVDHVNEYRAPKENDDDGEELKRLHKEGCAPKIESPAKSDDNEELSPIVKKSKKGKKTKKVKREKKKKKKKKKESSSESDSSEDSEKEEPEKIKQEKFDPGYDRQENNQRTRPIERRRDNQQQSEGGRSEIDCGSKERMENDQKRNNDRYRDDVRVGYHQQQRDEREQRNERDHCQRNTRDRERGDRNPDRGWERDDRERRNRSRERRDMNGRREEYCERRGRRSRSRSPPRKDDHHDYYREHKHR